MKNWNSWFRAVLSLLLLFTSATTGNAFVLFVAPPPADSASVRRLRVLSSRAYKSHSDDDGFDENPDLVGVKIEGFPIPPLPKRDPDPALMEALDRLKFASTIPLDTPMKSRSLVDDTKNNNHIPLRVLIAGGGLGGLALASALLRQGVDVHVLEQAVTYRPFGGPIQLQSNALWALQQINPVLFSAVVQAGVPTGDRLAGIKDGTRYQEGWLVQFDAATPAIHKGLPLTLAINRVVLQDIFLTYGVPPERVHTSKRVVGYQEHTHSGNGHGVTVYLQDGTVAHGDVLVGADGIWSRVRHQLYNLPPHEAGPNFATKHARYSGYTCLTGTCQHTPHDIDQVAYKVFLGQQQYFGCTDCGHGWQHWWAFLPDPPEQQSQDVPNANDNNNNIQEEPMLDRLRREFAGWSPEIHDLFDATKPEVVKKRPLFDRPPLFPKGWTSDFVTLLGDAAHPTLPNLGQGGAMATEDAFVLAQEFRGIRHTKEIKARLKAYEKRRFLRASIAQFLSRNGSDLLVDWETLRNTPIVGPFAMWCVNQFQPISMNYLYSADI